LGGAGESCPHLTPRRETPALANSGTRLFEHLGGEPIQLETSEVIETAAATIWVPCRKVSMKGK
jgi:hypothetical protein